MRYRNIAELKVSNLCLGTNIFGWTIDRSQAFAVLDAFRAAGGSFLDTADVYSAFIDGLKGGESETIIGEWMATRGCREETVLATKVGAMGPLTAQNIRSSLEGSLRRLQTDYVDIYYAHIYDTETPLEDTLGTFDALIREGKVRQIAASNHSAAQLVKALGVSNREGFARYVALSPCYNLIDRHEYESELRAVCERESVMCVPYYGLARGFLTGKFSSPATAQTMRGMLNGHDYADNARAHALASAVVTIAQELNLSAAAVALSWLAMQPTVTAPIASARTPGQLADLLAMNVTTLSAEQLARLRGASVAAGATPHA